MKKIENNFAVTGFVAKDAEVRQFTTTSVARFPLAVARQEKNGEDTKRISAFMNIEAWRKNENTGSFDQLTKGTLLTVEGYFKPEEWTDKDGVPVSYTHLRAHETRHDLVCRLLLEKKKKKKKKKRM